MNTLASSASPTIGQRLKRARLLKNLTQEELGRRASVSERSIRKLENGETIQTDVFFSVLGELGYLSDMVAILERDKPTTIEEHQAIGQGRLKRRLRAR